MRTYELVMFLVLSSSSSTVSHLQFLLHLHQEVSLFTLSQFLDSSPHSLCLIFGVFFSEGRDFFRYKKKPVSRDTDKGKEKVPDDAPCLS